MEVCALLSNSKAQESPQTAPLKGGEKGGRVFLWLQPTTAPTHVQPPTDVEEDRAQGRVSQWKRTTWSNPLC